MPSAIQPVPGRYAHSFLAAKSVERVGLRLIRVSASEGAALLEHCLSAADLRLRGGDFNAP
jgi:hypothetical protein